MIHNKAALIAAGYKYAGITVKCTVIGHWQVRRIAIYKNVTYDSLHFFRTNIGEWAAFYTEDIKQPFQDMPLLP